MSVRTRVRALRRDERGSSYVEALIAVPVLFLVFGSLFTFIHVSVAHIVAQRAASAAARAAVVFMPDDPVYYAKCDSGESCKDYVEPGKQAAKEACVKKAALKVLTAARMFKLDPPSAVKIDWNKAKQWEKVKLELKAQYDCSLFWGALICGLDGVAEIAATSTLNHQEGLTRSQAGL
jgi:hypothetical protein